MCKSGNWEQLSRDFWTSHLEKIFILPKLTPTSPRTRSSTSTASSRRRWRSKNSETTRSKSRWCSSSRRCLTFQYRASRSTSLRLRSGRHTTRSSWRSTEADSRSGCCSTTSGSTKFETRRFQCSDSRWWSTRSKTRQCGWISDWSLRTRKSKAVPRTWRLESTTVQIIIQSLM